LGSKKTNGKDDTNKEKNGKYSKGFRKTSAEGRLLWHTMQKKK